MTWYEMEERFANDLLVLNVLFRNASFSIQCQQSTTCFAETFWMVGLDVCVFDVINSVL